MALKLRVIGTNRSRTRFLVARDIITDEYSINSPVAVFFNGEWSILDGALTLGMAYKFGLWDNENDSKNEVLETAPEEVISHLKRKEVPIA